MKQNGAFMPHGAPAQWGGSKGAVACLPASSSHHYYHQEEVKNRRQRNYRTIIMMSPITVVLLCLVSCSLVFGDENGDITNGYSLGPDITSTTEFGK